MEILSPVVRHWFQKNGVPGIGRIGSIARALSILCMCSIEGSKRDLGSICHVYTYIWMA